jgi:hypothetical protein
MQAVREVYNFSGDWRGAQDTVLLSGPYSNRQSEGGGLMFCQAQPWRPWFSWSAYPEERYLCIT